MRYVCRVGLAEMLTRGFASADPRCDGHVGSAQFHAASRASSGVARILPAAQFVLNGSVTSGNYDVRAQVKAESNPLIRGTCGGPLPPKTDSENLDVVV
jgi:hypothetical protein